MSDVRTSGDEVFHRCELESAHGAGGKGDTIPLYWHRGYRRSRGRLGGLIATIRHGSNFVRTLNVGDDVSPVVVSGLAGRPIDSASARACGKLIAIGSILGAVRHRDTIWGTGLPTASGAWLLRGKRRLHIGAVRGPLTRKAIEQFDHSCPEVYGDPGLLLPLVHPAERRPERRIGFVPHKQDVTAFREMWGDSDGS